MSGALVLELTEEVYKSVTKAAEATGRDAPEWIALNLPRLLPFLQESTKQEARPPAMTVHREIYPLLEMVAAQTGKPTSEVVAGFLATCAPKPRQELMEEESRRAWEQLLQHCGAVNSGDAKSADNDRIDADLAREYGDEDRARG